MLPVVVQDRVVYIHEQAGVLGGEESSSDLVQDLFQALVTLIIILWMVPCENIGAYYWQQQLMVK